MASYYVRSGAGGAGTGADWANAFTTMTLALSGKAAGDIFYVAGDHAESTAGAITLTSPGTLVSPCYFYCVNHAGTVPPVSADLLATGEIATTGASSTINVVGTWVVDGLIFNAAKSGATGAINLILNPTTAERACIFRNCSLRIGTTGNGTIALGSANASRIELRNTTMSWAGTTGALAIQGDILWINTPSALSGTLPTQFMTIPLTRGGSITCIGVDLSALGAGKTIVPTGSTLGTSYKFLFIDCKLDASVTRAAAPASMGGVSSDFIRCGASGINYEMERSRYAGVLTTETTIVRTGGASDGTTTYSWQIDTTANAEWVLPFECPPIFIWNDVDGSAVTATVEGIWGGGAVPRNDDIWIDVVYLGDNTNPNGFFATSTKADGLAADAAITSSSETWGGSTTEFKMAATFTPQQKGMIAVSIKAGLASSTFYVDPKITLS